jgi:hypothetical protein
MTFKKKMIDRRTGRHALRSSAAMVGGHAEPTTLHPETGQATDAVRTVLAHTSLEWNALRHAC